MSGLLQEYSSGQAALRGDATALVMGEERLSYRELEAASNRLARLLVEAGCRRGDRVCLFSSKAPVAITAMVAVLKAGCAYVPIDIASPAARVSRIVRSADPTMALVMGSGAALVEELLGTGAIARELPLGALDAAALASTPIRYAFGPAEMSTQAADPLPSSGSSTDPAHVLFTSGSTGDPKGVVITHANVRAFIEWAVGYFGIQPGERVSGHPPFHFDLSTFDIYGTFKAGAELHLVPQTTLLPHDLAEFISSARLHQWFCVPSTMTYMSTLGALPEQGFPSLHRILWCGEVLPTPILKEWMQRVPQASFTNLYGPTETTIASSHYTVPAPPQDEIGPIPIGTACAGEELLVLDEQRQAVPQGQIGELYIGGDGVSPGYWRDEERTRESFVADRRGARLYRTGDLARAGADGLLYFLGRADSQIKSRGYRIELGEIEAALNTLPEVAECAVVGVPTDGFEGTAICCAFAPAGGAEAPTPSLRASLSGLLPAYMLPARWLTMKSLPKNVNGKIDRRRLREQFGGELVRGDADGHA